jgi:Ala-tRNA(Pro) deacylase
VIREVLPPGGEEVAMMILRRLQEYLDRHHVHYEVLVHEEAYTAPEVAHSLHVSGKMLVKVVMIRADQRFVMALLPATRKIDFARLKKTLRCRHVRLATEDEFIGLFPDCDIGTMPPFGNLYAVPVYVDKVLAEDEEIVFEAGTHLGAVKLRYEDFTKLVHPIMAEFHQVPRKLAG